MRGKTRVREFRISPTTPLPSHKPTNDNVVIIIFENAFGGKNKGILKRERVFLACVHTVHKKKMLLRKLRICLRVLFLYAENCVRGDAAAAIIGFGISTYMCGNKEELQLRIFIFFM